MLKLRRVGVITLEDEPSPSSSTYLINVSHNVTTARVDMFYSNLINAASTH